MRFFTTYKEMSILTKVEERYEELLEELVEEQKN